ncbi:hypothetical protein C5Q96_05240 [Mogibacterium diversum]|uniref:Phage protein n=1 Tax=Mogibacterium diversum TaxID=114527 RepID=A0A2S0L4S5_9FIRM|nr:hypothetical protein C5Q96_05240 [Mogibacterium diversum]
MTRSEIAKLRRNVQLRLDKKLEYENVKHKRFNSKEYEGYKLGILTAKSIMSDIFARLERENG